MCAICNKYPCDTRCPNAPAMIPVHTCTECGDAIFVGERYFDSPDGPICKSCMDCMSTSDLLDILGVKYSVASNEE